MKQSEPWANCGQELVIDDSTSAKTYSSAHYVPNHDPILTPVPLNELD